MHRTFLLLLLLTLPFLLWANDLDLGNIIIEGKGEIAVDSLISLQRFGAYNQIKQKELLAYQTPYSAANVQTPQQQSTGERGYLFFRLGEVLAADLKAKILLPQSKWLGFKLAADFWEYEQDWNFQTASFSWQPYLETEYLKASFHKSQMQWDHGFLSNNLAAGNFQFRSGKFALAPQLQLDYLEVKTEVGALDFEVDHPANVEGSAQYSANYEEFYAAGMGSYADFMLNLKYAYIRANHLADVKFGWRKLMIQDRYICDELALNFWYEQNDEEDFFWPMLSWQARYDLFSKLDFIFSNQPEIDYSFFSQQYFRELYLKEISQDELLPKKIINLTTALQYNSFLPITLAVNYSEYKDLRHLNESDLMLDSRSLDLHELSYSAQIAYQYKFFDFRQKAAYYAGDKSDLHLQNKWLVKTQFIFSSATWRVNLDFQYQQREIAADFTDLLPERLWLISLTESYDIRPNLQIQAELNNILNIDNRSYSFQPKSAGGFQFNLGMKYSF